MIIVGGASSSYMVFRTEITSLERGERERERERERGEREGGERGRERGKDKTITSVNNLTSQEPPG